MQLIIFVMSATKGIEPSKNEKFFMERKRTPFSGDILCAMASTNENTNIF